MSVLDVTHGSNDLLFTTNGNSYIDLVSSTGAVFMGHANSHINEHIIQQLGKVSCSWTSTHEIHNRCSEAMAGHIGQGYSLYSLFSTGMEAAEVAMRMAFCETGKTGLIGFGNNMHGKSIASQNVSRKDSAFPDIDSFIQLPFIPDVAEEVILERVEKTLRSGAIAAIFIEPIQGRGGGHCASEVFYQDLEALCRQHNTLIICDEILTGLYRTGPAFRYSDLNIRPDIVLVGKALGNGFPVSGIITDDKIKYHPMDFRFNSTYSNNPVASAAVIGTLAEMERVDVVNRVSHIAEAFSAFYELPGCETHLYGAFCNLHLESEEIAEKICNYLLERNILIFYRENTIGFLPMATTTEAHLDKTVEITKEAFAKLT